MAEHDTADADLATPQRAVVARLFDTYGFLLTPDCREIRFERSAVLRDEFDELRVGSEVFYEEGREAGGSCATAVDLQSVPQPPVEHIEEQIGASDEVPEMPDADLWQEK
jgi:hypothetical protein